MSVPSKHTLLLALPVALLSAFAALAQPAAPPAPPSPAAPPTPATPAAPPLPPTADQDAEAREQDARKRMADTEAASKDAEARLQEARQRLEEAAREVAQLSAQLSAPVIAELLPYTEGAHAIIGVQLDDGAGASGARVHEVSPGGPAADAGVRAGDVIVSVNGTSVSGAKPVREVTRLLRDVKPDSHVKVGVLRDNKAREFVLTARARPGGLAQVVPFPPDIALPAIPELPELRGAFVFRRPLTDMELVTLTPQLGSYFGSDHGVLVVRAPADGALQLQEGDVILAIDGREPRSGAHATRILASYQPGEKVTLRILRQRKTLNLDTQLPAEGDGGRRTRARAPAPQWQRPERPVVYGSDSA
jgi:C-terminal processing protease CtpA/Prc